MFFSTTSTCSSRNQPVVTPMRTSYPSKAGSRALALTKSVRGARGKFCPLIRARVFHVFTFWFLYFLVSRRKDSLPEEKGKDDFTLHVESAPLCLGKNILIHMARECVPQVSFGGVGSIVGDLARIQAVTLPDTEVFVVLPKYGFINASQHIGTFSFLRGRRRISGVLFHSYSNRINYLFVSAPSHLSRLWKSGNPNNIYNLPQGLGSRGWIERDLYFSYVTMHIVRHLHECRALNSIVNAGKLETNIVLHIHGNLNLPVTWFLKQRRMKKVSTIYTMHDYADERRWCTIRDLAVWQYLTGGELDIFYTSLAPLGSRPIKRISLLSFLHFADIITAVSHGQVKEILQRGGDVIVASNEDENRLGLDVEYVKGSSGDATILGLGLVYAFNPNNTLTLSYEVKSFSFDAGTMDLTYTAIPPAQRSGVVNASENIGLSDEADVLSLTFRHQF